MLKHSPVEDSEEIAVHNYEGFGSYQVSEYEGITEIQAIAEFIDDGSRGRAFRLLQRSG